MKSLQEVHVNPGNAILVIVDAENEFLKPGGKLFNRTKARVSPAVISAIRTLIKQARSAGIPVVYIQSVRTLEEPEFTIFGRLPHLKVGSWAVEIVEELKPREGEVVIQKFSHDPFYRTDLDKVLQRLVPDSTRCYAVVTGGAVHVCLYHAVLGFHLRNYWTVVPVDCVFYARESDRQLAFRQFSGAGYPNVFLSRSDLIRVSSDPTVTYPAPIPGI